MLQLKLLNLLYELQPVRVTVLRSCKNIPTIDVPIQKGSQVSLPRFIANIFESYGLAEIAESILAQQDIAKVKFAHMQHRGSIPRIDDFFYIKVKESIKRLLSKAKSEGDIVLLRNIEKMREDFMDISNIRLSSIFRAFQLKGIDIVEKSCTMEERVLVNIVRLTYSKWVKEYIELD